MALSGCIGLTVTVLADVDALISGLISALIEINAGIGLDIGLGYVPRFCAADRDSNSHLRAQNPDSGRPFILDS